MQVYASVQCIQRPPFDTVSPWQPAVDSWDLVAVLCASARCGDGDGRRPLHAISVKCHVHYVRMCERRAAIQEGWTLSTLQDYEEQQVCFRGNSASSTVVGLTARATQERALGVVIAVDYSKVGSRVRASNNLLLPYGAGIPSLDCAQ